MGGSGFLRPDFVGCAFQDCRPLCFLGGFFGGYLSGIAYLVPLTQSRPLFLRHFVAALFPALALDNALEDALDNGGGVLVQNPFLAVVRVVQIAVGQRAGDVLSRRRPRAENRPYLPAGISGVPRDTVL